MHHVHVYGCRLYKVTEETPSIHKDNMYMYAYVYKFVHCINNCMVVLAHVYSLVPRLLHH